jgi:hypothetical protein
MAHNGARSQIVPWFLDSGAGLFAFNNLLKVARNWSPNPDPDTLDANGYPTSLPGGTIGCQFWFPPQSKRAGNHVVKWTGTATLSFSAISGGGTYTVVSGSLSGTDGRAVINVGGSGSGGLISQFLNVTALGGSQLTSIQICHVDDEARMDAGYTYQLGFIEKLQEIGPGIIRFLDWQNVNLSMIGLWAHRKPSTYFSFVADEARADYWAGNTTYNAGTNTYAVGTPPAWTTLADRRVLLCKMDSAGASGTAYLDVTGIGPKPILGWYGTEFSATNITLRHAMFIYNEYLDGWQMEGADQTSVGRYLDNWIPIEALVELSNELGSHPWVHIPYLALDNSNRDFATNLATYLRDNLASGLIPIYEPANEIWNPGAAFKATTYARTYALARWGVANDDANWQGMILSLMGEDISAVYSDDRSRYKVVCAVQTYGATNVDRIESTRWVAEGGGNTPASDWTTHGCVAGYWSFSSGQANASPYSSREMQLAYDYSLAPSDAILTDLITTRIDNNERTTPTNVKTRWALWKTFFDGYGLPLLQYEGGYSPDYLSSALQRVANAATQANPCVLTLAANSVSELPPVGSSITFPTISVGMTQLSGNTYTVLATSGSYNSAGNTITIDVDASGFSAWSGSVVFTFTNMMTMLNTLRAASKYADEIGTIEAQLYADFADYGGSFPSMYMLAGNTQAWAVFDPTRFDDPTPRWQAILDFNAAGESVPEVIEPTPGGKGRGRKKKDSTRFLTAR